MNCRNITDNFEFLILDFELREKRRIKRDRRIIVLTRYRLESSQKKVVYDGTKIYRELDWVAPVSLNNVVEYEKQREG